MVLNIALGLHDYSTNALNYFSGYCEHDCRFWKGCNNSQNSQFDSFSIYLLEMCPNFLFSVYYNSTLLNCHVSDFEMKKWNFA